MSDYKDKTTKALLEEKGLNEELMLKSKKIYKMGNLVQTLSSLGAFAGLCVFLGHPNSIIKMVGFGAGVVIASIGITSMGSKKYMQAKHQYENSLKIDKEISEELDKRFYPVLMEEIGEE